MSSISTFAEQTPGRIERMRRTPADLESMISGPVVAMADSRPAMDAWSIVEIVCHLRDVEEAYLDRMLCILANEDPVLVQFDPGRWVEERQYRRHEVAQALLAFRARRNDTLAVIDSLIADQWDRGGRHPSRGHLTVRKIVHIFAKHDTEHVEQIARAAAGQP